MRQGVLRQGFTFNTVANLVFKVPKGVRVVALNDAVHFHVDDGRALNHQPVMAWRDGERFYVSFYGAIYKLQPFNPRVPYPLSMLS